MTGRRLRVAVGQISSESNQFVPFTCELETFRDTGFLYQAGDVFKLAGTDGEVSGMLSVLEAEDDVEVVPLLAARAVSSGPLSQMCYEYLRSHLLSGLMEAGSVDGVLLSFHGSMAAVGEDDPEGDILSAARNIAGPDAAIVVTLDLHGNVTKRMVENSNAILGYEQYPHRDVQSTGERAARLLLDALSMKTRPVTAHAKVHMLLTAFNASTDGEGPFARLMRQAKALEQEDGILSASVFLVGSYLDMPDMGCSAVVVTDGDKQRALMGAQTLASEFWRNRFEYEVETLSIAEAVARGREVTGGPVLLVDAADGAGGGAAVDSVAAIQGLLDAGVTEASLTMVVDPEAAEQCHAVAAGDTITVELGHKVDPKWGRPIRVTGQVTAKTDGRFQYTGGILGGSWATMGPSAVLKVGAVQILIMSYATYDWADEQYRSAGLDAAIAKFVLVKNMMNFRIAYGSIMKAYFVLNLPGPTTLDMRTLPFRRVRRPIYPLDAMETPSIACAVASQPS